MQSGLGGAQFGLGDPKWQLPGWRIEQKYATGVLIGNWDEDRLGKFKRGNESGDSTHRTDFRHYSPATYQPDVSTRRRGMLMNNGLRKDHIFTHHGTRYMHNSMSLYDQQFNRRHSVGSRKWDRHRLAWLPEASDNPLQGESTNFGLKEEVEQKWKRLKELESHGDFSTTYAYSFRSHPPDSSPLSHHATPRYLSSHLHPHKVNKDLHLRGKPQIVQPEVVDPRLLEVKTKMAATV